MSWNLIHSLAPPARGAIAPEHERALVNDRIRNDVRERPYYPPTSVSCCIYLVDCILLSPVGIMIIIVCQFVGTEATKCS